MSAPEAPRGPEPLRKPYEYSPEEMVALPVCRLCGARPTGTSTAGVSCSNPECLLWVRDPCAVERWERVMAERPPALRPDAPRGPDALRPCPFCGCDRVRVDSEEDGAFFVRCPDCGAEGPVTLVAEHAKQEWNDRRAAPSVDAGRAAELADALDRAATVASDTITGPVEVPITSGMMREAAAWLRSRASAPPDREQLAMWFWMAIEHGAPADWPDCSKWKVNIYLEQADAVLAALTAGGPAHAPPRTL